MYHISYTTMIYDVKSEFFQRLLTGCGPPRVKGVTHQDTNTRATNNTAKPLGPTGSA